MVMIRHISLGVALFLISSSTSLSSIAPSNSICLESQPEQKFLDLPFRGPAAMSGSEFVENIRSRYGKFREDAIKSAVLSGNIPSSLRKLVPVSFSAKDQSGKMRRVKLWVTPDYLSVGTETDNLRVPLQPETAQQIADAMHMNLPTRKLVNVIFRKAAIKLNPKPLPPSSSMATTDYYERHNTIVNAQIDGSQGSALVAGHKKDVVLTNQLFEYPDRVAIYGWHRKSGRPIQPLSLVHGKDYVDYSHGVRLVSRRVEIDGQIHDYKNVLRDADLAPLLSDEGQLIYTAYVATKNLTH